MHRLQTMTPKQKTANSQIDPFTDLLFNILLIFTFLFLVTIVFLNPPVKTGTIDLKAEYVITVKWPDHNPDDIDVWVENPEKRLVWFRNTDDGFMHLDRDDRGITNDLMYLDGQRVVNPINQEVVTIRRVVPGEYTVNLHYYKSNTGEPVMSELTLARVNPKFKILFYGKTLLEKAGDEKTVVRFHLSSNHTISEMNTLYKSLVSVESG